MTGAGIAGEAARSIADLCLALDAVVRAGERVALDFGRHGDVRLKSPVQPVTDADVAVDRSLRERLLGERPGYGWLSEETADDALRLERDRVWIVDPIDGTTSFIAGYPDSVVAVGLVDARTGTAVIGVVFNPLTGELYWAVRGGGAYGVLIGTARHVEVEAPLDGLARVASVADIGPDGWGRFMIVHDVRTAPRHPLRVLVSREDEAEATAAPPGWVRITRGSTAYKMVGVASGIADAYYARGPKSEWDLCGASLIVEESGGRATDLNGEELRFNLADTNRTGIVCAADPAVHAQLLDWLRSGWRGPGKEGVET
ncbi:MAG TPA: 3'(2'),5'-bisphosphate nucleotidase CysQ [Longimicrobiales bacterium]|nr:3'(2'),5'-bisphosphate nucleotidase CysQ [Longimicrobiales bacterium]